MELPNLYQLQPSAKPNVPNKQAMEINNVWQTMVTEGKLKVVGTKSPGQILDAMQYRPRQTWTKEETDLMKIRLENQAYSKLIYHQYKEVLEKELNESPETLTDDPRIIDHVNETNAAGGSSRYLCFTVNVKPEAQSDLNCIKKYLDKATTKTWIKRYLCSYEQRGLIGTPEFGTGLHINLLVEKKQEYMSKKASKCYDEMKNTFKHIVKFDGYNDKKLMALRFNWDPTNFVNYINGLKEEEKLPLVEADKVWRQQLGIPDTFGTWDEL